MSFYKKYGTRYNFDRVMPDHRYLPDVNSKHRLPFSHKNYLKAMKYLTVTYAKKNPQLFIGIGFPILCLAAFFGVTSYIGVFNKDETLRNNKLLVDYRYFTDVNNRELGHWNSKLNCFENDPGCNKDLQ